jgi:arylsulfatase A-like enzyme
VHLFAPHAPYAPPDPYRTDFQSDPYAGEIAFVDAQLARLLHMLRQRGLWKQTVIVIAGDHGEALGDHGEAEHGIFLYESVLRVPFIVRAPGVEPRRVRSVVRLVDILPTVLELLDVPAPATDGVSALKTMTGGAPAADLTAYAESLYPSRFGWAALRAVRDGRFKLIAAPRPELYDLAADPGEQRNLHAERPHLRAALSSVLLTFERPVAEAAAQTESEPSPELLERVAALGYVGAGIAPLSPPAGNQLPDPKDRIQDYNERLAKRRARDEAVR